MYNVHSLMLVDIQKENKEVEEEKKTRDCLFIGKCQKSRELNFKEADQERSL